jgi:hypothetical protein
MTSKHWPRRLLVAAALAAGALLAALTGPLGLIAKLGWGFHG